MPPTASDTPNTAEPRTGLAAPVARAVAEDLESLFPPEAATLAPVERRLRLGRTRRDPAAGRGRRGFERRAATVGAIVAAAFVGVSAGALFSRAAAPARPAPPPRTAAAPIQVSAPMLPSPGPLTPPAAPVATPAAQPSSPAPPAEAPPAALRRVSVHAAARSHHKLTRVSTACARHGRCGPAVTAADAHLRRAYAAAERAGVARPVLADYRHEWGRLRHRAPHQPGVVAARYRQMAGELDRMAEARRVARVEPRPVGPWRRFRMQLAALWR